MESVLSPPEVTLKHVALGQVDFSRQTFVLSFGVSNPNAFSVPINYVSYGVKLNEQQFASGETVAAFSVPANGASEFAISVDLDLLRTAPQLLYTVRDGVNGSLLYELRGKLGIDLPLADRVSFRSNGEVQLNASDMHGRNREQ
jgi:LEA14-like dessication related protein